MCADDAEMASLKAKNIWVIKSKVKGETNNNSEKNHNNLINKNCPLSKFRAQVRNIR